MSTLDKLINETETIQGKISSLKDEMNGVGTKMLAEINTHVFQTYPWIESFSWKQYTPYFMDGDPCEFSANTDYININEQDDWEFESESFNITEDAGKKAFEEITSLLNLLGDAFLLNKFGDHAQVSCIRGSGYSVSRCDHD